MIALGFIVVVLAVIRLWPRRPRLPRDEQVQSMYERVRRWNKTSRWTRLP